MFVINRLTDYKKKDDILVPIVLLGINFLGPNDGFKYPLWHKRTIITSAAFQKANGKFTEHIGIT